MSVNKSQLKDEALCRKVVQAYMAEEKPIIAEVASRFRISLHTAQAMVHAVLSPEERERERVLRLSRSKIGDRNPMKGKSAELHHNYKGRCSDGKGYVLVLKPSWFTGRAGSKHVFEHQVVMCEALGLTEMPAGFQVHHIDEDPTNNRLDNLAMVTATGHGRLHNASPWRKLSPWEKHVYGILK
jgi:hypothetical protein